MKPLTKRVYVLSTHLHGNERQKYLDTAYKIAGTLTLTRDKAYAKTFTDWRSAGDVAIAIWSQYRCALYLKEVICETPASNYAKRYLKA